MSVFKTAKSAPYYWYDFRLDSHRFHGSTRCKTRKQAEKFEALERERAKALLAAQAKSRASLAIDDVANRFWEAEAKHYAEASATETNIARLVEYFGKTTPLCDIDHIRASEMVAWRRGHRVSRRGKMTKEEEEKLPLISNATVNRSAIAVLRRIFSFAKDEGARFDDEPKWKDLFLEEPVERVRELQDSERASLDNAMRSDYEPFFAFAIATGLRFKEVVTLKWSEVNFGTRQIVRLGKGKRRVTVAITPSIRDIIFPLQGQHDEFVFTYVAVYGNRRVGRIKGERYPLTVTGAKTAWQKVRADAGLRDFRFHDIRHDFGSKLLRESGGNFKLVQKALNHRDIASTARYAHVLNDDIAVAVERLAQYREKSRTDFLKGNQVDDLKAKSA